MRILFMGTPEFSVPALEALVAAGHEIAAVYTQPPRPAGRGKKDRPSAVQRRAETLGLPVRYPVSLKTPEAQAVPADQTSRCLADHATLRSPILIHGVHSIEKESDMCFFGI